MSQVVFREWLPRFLNNKRFNWTLHSVQQLCACPVGHAQSVRYAVMVSIRSAIPYPSVSSSIISNCVDGTLQQHDIVLLQSSYKWVMNDPSSLHCTSSIFILQLIILNTLRISSQAQLYTIPLTLLASSYNTQPGMVPHYISLVQILLYTQVLQNSVAAPVLDHLQILRGKILKDGGDCRRPGSRD